MLNSEVYYAVTREVLSEYIKSKATPKLILSGKEPLVILKNLLKTGIFIKYQKYWGDEKDENFIPYSAMIEWVSVHFIIICI